MDTQLRIIQELENRTPDEIAETMRKLGIKGTRSSKESCPVAKYLQREGLEGCKVGNIEIEWVGGTHPTERGIDEFIDAFDREEYPDLIDPESEGGV